MKTLDALLSELRQQQVHLWLDNDRLRYRAPEGTMTPDLLGQLKAHKAEILAFLQTATASTSTQHPPLLPVERSGDLLPSFAQQRLWLLQQFEPDTPANNMPVVVRFTGTLELSALEQSLTEILRRHESLRTTFPVVDGQPTLAIAVPKPIALPVIDLQTLPAEQREVEAHRLTTQDAKQPFDLVNGPVAWFKLFQLAAQEHLLLWNMHAIVCDGTSADVFYQELTTLYAAFLAGLPSPLAELPIQYADFAQWQRQWLQGEVLESYLNYWKQTLSGKLPLLQLPTDHPRPSGRQTYRGDRYARMLPKTLHHDLMHLSQQLGTTLFVTLLTTFNTLLHRYSQQTQLLTTFVSSGRSQVETEALMGFFSNTLILRTQFDGNPLFRDLIQQVHRSVLEAYTYQDLPFEKLVEELRPEQNQSRSPLYQIKFTLNPPWTNGRGMTAVELPDLTIKALFGYIYNGKTKFDLTLVMREQDEGLGAVFDFNADLFDVPTIERMMGHFQTLLEGIVANPERHLSELPLLTATEQQQLLQWQQPTHIHELECIHHRFETQVEQTPDAIALVFGNQTLTYRELDHQANQLAHYLQQLGVQTGTPVGIYLERSLDAIVAMLGILKAGGAYVPLDLDTSSEYQRQVVATAPLTIIIADTRVAGEAFTNAPKLVCLDRDEPIMRQQSIDRPASAVTIENLATIVHPAEQSSQSTRICLSHRSLIRCTESTDSITLTANEVCLHRTALSHPLAAFELWGSLLNGAKLVILPHQASVVDLGQTIRQHQVTTLWLPTRLFHHLVAQQLDDLVSVRQMLTGSDPLAVQPVQTFLQDLPHRTLVQTYNFPEHPAWICTQTITPSILLRDAVPLGMPTGTTQVAVLDQHLHPVAIGIPGELYVGGNGVASDRSLAPEGIVQPCVSLLQKDSSAGLHKTGQRVRWLPEGTLELLGQIDSEVALHPPVNLRQVEAAIGQHVAVQEVYVRPLQDSTDASTIVAYLVLHSEQATIANELRNFLKPKLPGHLIPSIFICLRSLPLAADGEIDCRQLPAPDSTSQALGKSGVSSENETERQLTEIWQTLLGIAAISLQDNFFDLGGDSLLAVRLFTQIEKTFGKQFPLSILLQSPTIEQLAQVICQQAPIEAWSPLVTIQQGRAKPPLFCIHGGGFNVLIYRDLASKLPSDQPVYGLQARGLEGDTAHIKYQIKAIATDYVKQIKRVQPEGPYFLSGLSSGGTIALEMAQQLHMQGQPMALVVLFDSFGPDSIQLLPSLPRLVSSLQYALRYSVPRFAKKSLTQKPKLPLAKIQQNLKALKALKQPLIKPELTSEQMVKDASQPSLTPSRSLEDWMNRMSQFILDHSSWAFFSPTAQLQKLQGTQGSMSETLKALEQSHSQAHKIYRPKPYKGKMILFRATELPPGFQVDPRLGWDTIAEGGLEVYRVPGDHTSIMSSPILAEQLKICLEKAQVDCLWGQAQK